MARFISPLGQTPDTKDISSSGNFTIDAIADIVLDADGDEVIFKDGSTNVGHISMDSDNFTIKSLVSDKDIIVQGNDGGSGITAITLDMSAAALISRVIAVIPEPPSLPWTIISLSLTKDLMVKLSESILM